MPAPDSGLCQCDDGSCRQQMGSGGSDTISPASKSSALTKAPIIMQDGVYRPSLNSKMMNLGNPFDAIAREQLIREFFG